MTILKKLIIPTTFILASTYAVQSNASFIIDDWQLDLTSVGGPTVSPIDAMGFTNAPVNASLTTDVGPAGTSVNDIYTIQGKGVIGTFTNDFTGDIGVSGLNSDFEVSFTFNLPIKVTSVLSSTSFTWTHVAAANVLKFYIDDITDGSKATPGNGTQYADGTLVATFDVLAGEGGSTNTAGTFDGSDDATFLLSTVNTAGILKDQFGVDLAAGATLALTNSNFDLDDNNNNNLDEIKGGFGCTTVNQSATFFCALEDGSINLATVPEPSTVALLGIGLGLIGFGARNKAQA